MSKQIVKQENKTLKTIPKNMQKSVLASESEINEDTDEFYTNIVDQFKTIIVDQYKELDEKTHSLQVARRAIDIQYEQAKQIIETKNNEIKDKDQKITLLEQDLAYHIGKKSKIDGKKANTIQLMNQMQDLKTKMRSRKIENGQLDEEALTLLKPFI